jgi:hypothetical protein
MDLIITNKYIGFEKLEASKTRMKVCVSKMSGCSHFQLEEYRTVRKEIIMPIFFNADPVELNLFNQVNM